MRYWLTRVGQFVCLDVEIAVRQSGCVLHLLETNRWARHEGGQDSEAGGGADHFVEVKVHDLLSFLLRSILPGITPCQASFRKKEGINFML